MKKGYSISTDKRKLDLKVIHGFLARSYWAENVPKEIVKKALKNSLCFGVYYKKKQVGFARVVSDYATIAYLGDVFILEEHRGKGLSKALMKAVMAHKKLQRMRAFYLRTVDAHGLYRQFGFSDVRNPQTFMEIKHENFYKKKA